MIRRRSRVGWRWSPAPWPARLVLAACGSTADAPANQAAGAGGVKTDKGVTDTTITLGIMGDTSGVFKNLGAGLNAGNQLWADDVNAAGGICSRQIAIETVDHGYKADTAKTLYPQLEPKVLGMVQLLGSPVLAALKQNLIDDNDAGRAGVLVEPGAGQPVGDDDRHHLRPGDHQRAGLPAAAGADRRRRHHRAHLHRRRVRRQRAARLAVLRASSTG